MNDRASSRAPQAGDTELSGPPAAEAIAPQVLRETASWLLLMQEGPLAPAQQSWRTRVLISPTRFGPTDNSSTPRPTSTGVASGSEASAPQTPTQRP
ncbi:hypothetical protein M770_34225 (plasmid) [Pseudomonas aeruginosa VRFPA03]|nr:hypothetical protein M770_34225 [Pseudomonas aeruginosa VRFPA03]